ncbi:cobyric acid synthase [Klebsiella pneumoniae]|uniref:Cobyric acid synthase n=1 Tax=Klebsiella pneumoniae TaxID=573 RepID=A0A378BST6_KLEPN|nr:cobyric acid synthase [Klebsiella pneumoniae]
MSAIRRRWPTPTWSFSRAVKNTLGDLCWLRESGMAHAVEQARQRKVPLLGICGAIRCWAKPLSMRWSLALAPSPGWGC